MKKAGDIYLKVISGAFVSDSGSQQNVGKVLIKAKDGVGGETLMGFAFDDLDSVDSVIRALQRARSVLVPVEKVHPAMHRKSDGTH